MNMQIMMFGKLSEITGNSISINDVSDTESMEKILHAQFPALADSKYVIAVNKKIIKENTILSDNSVVALLPPFSGG